MTILTPANAFPNLPFPQHGGNPSYPAGFNPTSLITGQGGFWRADAGVTGSPSVTQWNDQSSFANNLTVFAGGTNPTFGASSFNGFPGITFGGSTSNNLSAAGVNDASTTQSFFILLQQTDAGGVGNLRICGLLTPSDTTTPGSTLYITTGPKFGYFSSSELGNGGATVALTQNNFYLLGVVADGANVNKWVNGSVIGTGSAFSSTLGSATSTINMGQVSVSANGMVVAFWGVTQKVLSRQDWANLSTWANLNFNAGVLAGDFLNVVKSFTYPGAVWPNVNPPPPAVLSSTNAFPNLAFPQHGLVPTWNPATKSAGLVLSGGNLIANNPSGTGEHFGFCTNQSGANFYFEVVINTDAGTSQDIGIGCCDQTFVASPGSFIGVDIHATGYYSTSGAVFYNSAGPTLLGYTTGDNIGVAVDVANKKVWFRKNGGNWNNDILANQNPATNTGGVAVINTNSTAAISLRAATGSQVTAQFLASSWTYTAPSGFSSLGSGYTNTVQSFLFPGAVQPAFVIPPSLFTLMPQIVT